jgi:hypothetical protein
MGSLPIFLSSRDVALGIMVPIEGQIHMADLTREIFLLAWNWMNFEKILFFHD